MDITEKIKSSANLIRDKFSTKKIILFGSYAHGIPTVDSDIDLCIITDETNIRKIDITRDIRRELISQLSYPLDILVYYEKEFNEKAAIKNSFENTIINQGVELFG